MGDWVSSQAISDCSLEDFDSYESTAGRDNRSHQILL